MMLECQHYDPFKKAFAVRPVGLHLLLRATVAPMHGLAYHTVFHSMLWGYAIACYQWAFCFFLHKTAICHWLCLMVV
jgi:hypothetical protein